MNPRSITNAPARIARLGARALRLSLLSLSVIAGLADPASAQGANPYDFKKEAFKPDGTPWTGPVQVGDIIKYVLSYKPGTTNSGPVTIDDTLSPNLTYVPPTTASDAGWTWGSSPYSVGNHEQYKHPGFGPNTGSVKIKFTGAPPTTGQGDGTIPIPILSLNKAFGVFHHASGTGDGRVDCWDLTSLAKCGTPQPNATSGFLHTPTTPQSVVRGTTIYFLGYRPGGAVTIGCFEGSTQTACADSPLPASVGSNMGALAGLVEDGTGRVFAAVNDRAFCRVLSGSTWVTCPGWPAAGIVSVTGAIAPVYNSNVLYVSMEFGPSPTRLYIHHSNARIQCIDINTAGLCAGSWSATGTKVAAANQGVMFSSFPASGSSGDGGVCLWQLNGVQVGCLSSSGGSITVTPTSVTNVAISSFRIPGTGKVFFPTYPYIAGTGGPKCFEYAGTTGTPCVGYTSSVPPNGTQYGFALDPRDPAKCMLALGHLNLMWRFDWHTGNPVGCGTPTIVKTPDLKDIYCNGEPTLATFKWTTIRVLTAGTAGTLTVAKGTGLPVTQLITSGTTTYAMPAGIGAGYGQLSFTFTPAAGSPTTVEFEIGFISDKNPQICYQARVKACGPVFNTAVFKGNFSGAATNVTQTVNLGNATGPDCPELTQCLKDSKVTVKCNPDGTFTVTLNTSGFTGSDITVTSQTPGVTVTPPQQPWAATTTWTLTGATSGQAVTLYANETKVGSGSAAGTDLCCSGEIKLVLPECKKPIDLKIGKENTAQGGSGTRFNLWVTNVGAPITFPAGALTVTDAIPAGMTVTSVVSPNWTCLPTTPPPMTGAANLTCTYNLAGSLATNAAILDSIIVHYTTTGPGPFKNCAKITVPPSVGVDSNPPNDEACVTVTGTDGKIDLAIVKTGGTSPVPQVNGYAFHLAVTNVGAPFNGTNVITVTDVVPAGMTFNNATGTNWTCMPLPASAGTTITCTYTGPGPTAPGQSLGTIDIVATATGSAPFPPFRNCAIVGLKPGSGSTDVNPSNNESCVTVAKPGVSCPPPLVAGPVPGQCICPSGTVLMGKECVKQTTCQPPMVPGPVTGQCICPPGTHLVGNKCEGPPPPVCRPPMVPGPIAGQCICPLGTIQKGRECVRPIVCRPPLIANPAGSDCVCPQGSVLRDKECIKQPVCNPPAKLNRRGACECPTDMVARGNTCIERERPRPQISPGFPRDGRDNPRNGRDTDSPRGGQGPTDGKR